MTAEGPPEPVLVVLQRARGTLRVTGPEAKTWLNGLVTCDVLPVAEGRGAFGLALNKQGKIQSEVEIVATPDGLLVGVSPGVDTKLGEALDKFLVMEDAELSVVTSAYLWADFHGLGAGALAESAARACGGFSGIMPFTPAGGASVVLERARSLELERFIAHTVTLQLASEEDWDAFRIEQVLGRFGVDFGETDNPHEAALDRRAVSWSKGCYLGQEVVCMQDMRGKLKRRLVALSVETADLPVAGAPVTSTADGNSETVGEVTSAALSPTTGKAVALARLKGPYFEGKLPLTLGGKSAAFVEQAPPE
jgi:folate-binding protein YgfZ